MISGEIEVIWFALFCQTFDAKFDNDPLRALQDVFESIKKHGYKTWT